MARHWFAVILGIWLAMLFLFWFAVSARTSPGLAVDDGYIHLVYARNLLHGHFFEYNPGERSSGSTSPGWVFLLAVVGAVVGLLKSAWVLGAVSLLLAALGTYFLTREFLVACGLESAACDFPAVVAAVVVLTYGRFVWNAFSGMETLLYSAVVAFVFAAYLWEYRSGKRFYLSSFLAALALWIRPESLLLMVLFVLFLWFSGKNDGRKDFVPIAIILISAAAYFGFNLFLTGFPLPNTFMSKSALYAGTRWDYITYNLSLFWHDNPVLFLTALFAPWIVLAEIRRRGKGFGAALPIFWLIAFPAAKFVVAYQEVHFGRYTIILLPVLVATVITAVMILGRRLPRVPYVLALAAVLVVPNLLLLNYWRTMTARTVWQINTIQGECAKALTKLIPNHDKSVALHDVGRIKFDTDLDVVDLAGLVSNDAARVIWQNRRRIKYSTISFDSVAAEIIARHKPDYMAVSISWFPYLTANRDAAKRLWQSRQLVDAVECIPEIEIYRFKTHNLDTLCDFVAYGRKFDLQWVLHNLLPDMKSYLAGMESADSLKRAVVSGEVRRQLEEKYPYFEVSLLNLARELVSLGLVEEGKLAAQLGINLYPDNPGFYNALGVCLFGEKQPARAAEILGKAVRLAPEAVEFRENYALALLAAGDTLNALHQIDTLLALNPSLTSIKKLRAELATRFRPHEQN